MLVGTTSPSGTDAGRVTLFRGTADMFPAPADPEEASDNTDTGTHSSAPPTAQGPSEDQLLLPSVAIAPPEQVGDVFAFGFGDSILVADIDGDDRTDLVVGAPRSEVAKMEGAGVVMLLPRRTDRLDWEVSRSSVISPTTLGLDAATNFGFGSLPGGAEGLSYLEVTRTDGLLTDLGTLTGSLDKTAELRPEYPVGIVETKGLTTQLELTAMSWDDPTVGHTTLLAGDGLDGIGRFLRPYVEQSWGAAQVRSVLGRPDMTPWDCAGAGRYGNAAAESALHAPWWDAFDGRAGTAGIEGDWGSFPPGTSVCIVTEVIVTEANQSFGVEFSTHLAIDEWSVAVPFGVYFDPTLGSTLDVCDDIATISWSTRVRYPLVDLP